jgi:hypothetical protein
VLGAGPWTAPNASKPPGKTEESKFTLSHTKKHSHASVLLRLMHKVCSLLAWVEIRVFLSTKICFVPAFGNVNDHDDQAMIS